MILAIDPGFSNFGYAIIDPTLEVVKIGLLKTEKSKTKGTRVSSDDAYRIQKLSYELAEVIDNNYIKVAVGEAPIGGGQSAISLKHMSYATSIANSVFSLMHIPIEWTTPQEVKKTALGKANATKEEMMVSVCKKHNWEITKKITNKKKNTEVNVYHPLKEKWPAKDFEHVADAIWSFHTLKHSNLVRMIIG